MSPIDWQIFLRILLAILRILANLPAGVDHRPVAEGLAEAIDLQVNGANTQT